MAAVTIPTDASCDLILASNADPTKAWAGQENGDQSPVHSYARANASLAAVHVIAGRQMPLGERPLTEGNADVFTRQLIVAIDTPGEPVATVDRAVFDPILALIEDPGVPYVALCDGHGRRWFVFPEFVDGTYDWRLHEHQANVKFTEVAKVPTAFETADPPTP